MKLIEKCPVYLKERWFRESKLYLNIINVLTLSTFIFYTATAFINYNRCTGHVKGVNKLQIFTIRQLQENDRNSFDRISLVSQWAVNDILLYKKV